MIHILLMSFLALGISESAFADNYALLIGGGGSGAQSEHQEFARMYSASYLGLRAQGYQVTGLFGVPIGSERTAPPAEPKFKTLDEEVAWLNSLIAAPPSNENERYSQDYDFMRSQNLRQAPVTAETIENSLRELVPKAKAGDRVEIMIAAHGSDVCPATEGPELEAGLIHGIPGPREDFDTSCHHEFSIFTPTGAEVRFPTDRLLPYLRELDRKGALVNLNLLSCYSGRAKSLFEGLHNTCVSTSSSGNSLGFMCMEDDFKDTHPATDFTSAGEGVTLRTYAQILPKLSQMPYFANLKCFKSLREHVQRMQPAADLSTMESAYWSFRRTDTTTSEPALSSLNGFDYFRTSNFSHRLTFKGEAGYGACVDAYSAELDRILARVSNLSRPVLKPMRRELLDLLKRYDDLLGVQRKLHQEMAEKSRALKRELKNEEVAPFIQRLALIQEQTRRTSADFIAKERQFVEAARQVGGFENPGDSACRRSLS